MSANPDNSGASQRPPTSPPTSVSTSRWPLWILIALFFGPLFVAMALYFGSDYRPPDRTNYGTLNEPVLPLPEDVSLVNSAGETLGRDALATDWTWIQFLPADCDRACEDELYRSRQTWMTLDRRRTRVQRIAIATADNIQALSDKAGSGIDPALMVVRAENAAALEAFFGVDNREPGRIFLIDPLGNWVMTWEPGYAPGGIQKDMKKLLKLSRVG